MITSGSGMERLGEYLTRMREEKGISLEDLSSKTRIDILYLKALEEDDLARLPVEVFAKGFLRAYAKMLSLDEKEVLTRFEESSREYYGRKSPVEWLREKKKAQAERDAKRSSFFISLVSGGLLVGLITILILHNLGSRPDNTDLEKGMEEVIIPPSSFPIKGVEAGLTEERVSDGPLLEEPKAEHPKEMLLEIDAMETTWVSARIDDTVVKEALLKPGDKVAWKASNKLFLTLGNAGGVNIKWNGKHLEPLGPRGKVIRDFLLSRD